MRTLTLLFLLVTPSGLPAAASPVLAHVQDQQQEKEAAEGSIIESAEISGLATSQFSPGLRQAIESLVGTPLARARLEELRGRIEGERPDVVAAVRAVSRPERKARVVFLVARISDDTALRADINARYVVESVSIEGVRSGEVSQTLRDELQTLVGVRLDPSKADDLRDRMSRELRGRHVRRRVERGTARGRVIVVFDVGAPTWLPFLGQPGKIVYHGDLGWTGVIGFDFGGGRTRAGVSFVLDNKDDLVEKYSGYRLGIETRQLGTHRLGAGLTFTSFDQTWDPATTAALDAAPGSFETYERRRTVEPMVALAFSPQVHVRVGVSTSELDGLSRTSGRLMANAIVVSGAYDQRWHPEAGVTHRFKANYELRSGTETVGSDFDYERHSAAARYEVRSRPNTFIATVSFGYIDGTAPLFERFTLGDSTTLRGWHKYDIAPAGGDRMFQQSVEYRHHALALFLDNGAVWSPQVERRHRWSTGFGLHGDDWFLTVGFPLNGGKVSGTFIAGVRF